MSAPQDSPQELFGLRLAHVGINGGTPEEASSLADSFAFLGLAKAETPVSFFAGSEVEVMKGTGRGERGHIGFAVDDIDAAERWFAGHGHAFLEDSRVRNPDGTTHLIYFAQDLGGFAVHLVQD